MKSVFLKAAGLRRVGLVTACVALVAVAQLIGAGKSPMKILKYDPAAEKMQMFDAIESGQLKVRVVAHDAKGGNMYFENLSGKPLTVEVPQALAIVHILKQFGGGMGGGGMGGGMGGMGGMQGGQGMGGGMGGGQMGGGGMGGMQGGMGGGGMMGGGMGGRGGGGGGFFSIPAERVAQVPYLGVCLNHGKPDPSPRMTYIPIRLENAVQDKVLREMLRLYGMGRIDFTIAQAAAWHITDKLSWDQLAAKKEFTLPGVYSSQVPTFTVAQLQAAHELLTVSAKMAEERAKSEPEVQPSTVKTRSPGETAKPATGKPSIGKAAGSKPVTAKKK